MGDGLRRLEVPGVWRGRAMGFGELPFTVLPWSVRLQTQIIGVSAFADTSYTDGSLGVDGDMLTLAPVPFEVNDDSGSLKIHDPLGNLTDMGVISEDRLGDMDPLDELCDIRLSVFSGDTSTCTVRVLLPSPDRVLGVTASDLRNRHTSDAFMFWGEREGRVSLPLALFEVEDRATRVGVDVGGDIGAGFWVNVVIGGAAHG